MKSNRPSLATSRGAAKALWRWTPARRRRGRTRTTQEKFLGAAAAAAGEARRSRSSRSRRRPHRERRVQLVAAALPRSGLRVENASRAALASGPETSPHIQLLGGLRRHYPPTMAWTVTAWRYAQGAPGRPSNVPTRIIDGRVRHATILLNSFTCNRARTTLPRHVAVLCRWKGTEQGPWVTSWHNESCLEGAACVHIVLRNGTTGRAYRMFWS